MKAVLSGLLGRAREKYPEIQGAEMRPGELIFEERVRMNCFYCGRYNQNWRCPPNLPALDYPKLFSEFSDGAFVYAKVPAADPEARVESSLMVHKSLLLMETALWESGNVTALSFIGGSCKLCKNGCDEKRCRNPYQARSPLEATGVNVVKSAARAGVKIGFPPGETIMRVGLIVW